MSVVVEETLRVSFRCHSKMEKLLSLSETAEILGIKQPTLYNWVSERKITVVKIGRLVKFDSKDVREFIEKNKRRKVNINSEEKT